MSQQLPIRTNLGQLAATKQILAPSYVAPAASKRRLPLRPSKLISISSSIEVKENSIDTLIRPINPRNIVINNNNIINIKQSVASKQLTLPSSSFNHPYEKSNNNNNIIIIDEDNIIKDKESSSSSSSLQIIEIRKKQLQQQQIHLNDKVIINEKAIIDEFSISSKDSNNSRKRLLPKLTLPNLKTITTTTTTTTVDDIDDNDTSNNSIILNNKKFKDKSRLTIPELDADDTEDPGMCAEYAQEIMEYLMIAEKKYLPDPDYILLHPDLRWNMRTVLVDWLIEVHCKFKLLPETIFLAINIMDRVLSIRVCEVNKVQLVGLTALFIAAKTEEVITPPVSQFAFMVADDFKVSLILEAEQYILRVLDYVFWAPGPFSFIRRISKVDDYDFSNRTLAKYFAEITLLEHVFLAFPPSLIAASSMWLARRLNNVFGWGPLFEFASGYTEPELTECVDELIKAVSKKYDKEVFFPSKYTHKRFFKANIRAQMLLSERKKSKLNNCQFNKIDVSLLKSKQKEEKM